MGYGTNSTTIPALAGSGSLIISDTFNHSSIVNGARASGAMVRTFAHNDAADLARVLREVGDRIRRRTNREKRAARDGCVRRENDDAARVASRRREMRASCRPSSSDATNHKRRRRERRFFSASNRRRAEPQAIALGRPRTRRPWTKILVMVEGIYSMEGEICNLAAIAKVCKAHRAYLYLDEASHKVEGSSGSKIIRSFLFRSLLFRSLLFPSIRFIPPGMTRIGDLRLV